MSSVLKSLRALSDPDVARVMRERFDYVFVATSILDLYSGPGRDLLAQSDQLCLEVTDNMATLAYGLPQAVRRP